MRPTIIGIAVALALTASVPSSVKARPAPDSPPAPGMDWAPDELIAQPVSDISTAASPAAVFQGGAWHVVYASGGDIWYRRNDPISGWGSPFRLSNNPAASRNPHIAGVGNGLLVVWEDERTGHPEIWSRAYLTGVWQAEVQVTNHDYVSRDPAIASFGDGTAFAVWDYGMDGHRAVRGAPWQNGQWGAAELVAQDNTESYEPAVAANASVSFYVASWTVSAPGSSLIYLNSRSPSGPYWGQESSFPSKGGSCRHSSVSIGSCCADVMMPEALALYENYTSGVPEIYGGCYELGYKNRGGPYSLNDGIPSVAPCSAEFDYGFFATCGMLGGPLPDFLEAWTDQIAPGAYAHRLENGVECPGTDSLITVASHGISNVLVAAAPGDPAQTLLLWIEQRNGVPSLIARRGTSPGCDVVRVVAPAFATLSPGGDIPTVAMTVNSCGGAPKPGESLMLDFSDCSGMTWDPQQPHPITNGVTTDAQGRAIFHLRGGGCVPGCTGGVICEEGGDWTHFTGVRSPDINGDCLVTQSDHDYVEAHLGTNDFCADLDGSGLVDAADLAVVDGLMGTHCSDLTSVGTGPVAGRLSLTAAPDPCRGYTAIDLVGASGETSIRILDIGGREVRSLDAPIGYESSRRVTWDVRDSRGRPVPSGLYTILVRDGRSSARRSVLVLR